MARGTFGEKLKREREMREVTWEEITSATRIGPRFLEALENEDWEKLPGGVFNRGFVRSIARYLGLDEEALLGEYDLAHGAQIPPPNGHPEQAASAQPIRWQPVAFILCAILLIIALVFGGLYAWRHFAATRNVRQTEEPPPTVVSQPAPPILPAADTIPVTSAAPQSAPQQNLGLQNTGPMDLLVSTSADTHVLVLSDGSVAFYDEMHAGEKREISRRIASSK